MATPQALGAQLYNPFISPDVQSRLLANQQQQAMAQALLQQGQTPIDTNGRMMGAIASKVSPLEGLAKALQTATGIYGQKQANSDYANILNPQAAPPAPPDGSSGVTAPQASAAGPMQNMSPQGQQILQGLMQKTGMSAYEAFQVMQDPSALSRIYASLGPTTEMKNAQYAYGAGAPGVVGQVLNNQANPGAVAYNNALGTTAAGNAPAGTMPSGVGGGGAYQGAAGALPVTPAPMTGQPDPGIMLPGPSGVAGGIPQVNASALNAPVASAPIASPPSPAGMTNDQYKAALDAWKAGQSAQAQVGPAGQKTQAEDIGKNIADATKTYNVAASSFPRAMQRFDELRQASKNASSGGGVSDLEPEQGLLEHFLPGPDYARSFARTSAGQLFEPKTATANQTLDQAAKQGILSELGPQLQGLKGNRYLETIASGASGLNPADPDATRQNAINGLQDQYISNMKSLAQQRRQYGDVGAPSDMDMAKLIAQHAPTQMISVVDPQGKLGRVSAQHLPELIQAGGQIR